MNKYTEMSDQQVNDELERIPKEEWGNHEKLLEEGMIRWLKLAGFTKEEYIIYVCHACKKQLVKEDMGKRCPHCQEWLYRSTSLKKVAIQGGQDE